jgi:hypothetical protein
MGRHALTRPLPHTASSSKWRTSSGVGTACQFSHQLPRRQVSKSEGRRHKARSNRHRPEMNSQFRLTGDQTSGSASSPTSRTPQEVVSCCSSSTAMPSRTSGRLRQAAPSSCQPMTLPSCHLRHPFATRASSPYERAAVPGVRHERTGRGTAVWHGDRAHAGGVLQHDSACLAR